MSEMNRRQWLVGAVTTLGGTAAAQSATGISGSIITGPTDKASGDFAGGSTVFAYSDVVPTKQANGSERINGFHGTVATGEAVSMHESWIPAGTPAVALHVIHHTEVIVVMEGEVELNHDGSISRAKAGDVLYVANGTNHYVKNVGAGTARYMVIQIGGDTR
jgi:mannose-6-phosphate isomerase-like protein (cupin superfamily)